MVDSIAQLEVGKFCQKPFPLSIGMCHTELCGKCESLYKPNTLFNPCNRNTPSKLTLSWNNTRPVASECGIPSLFALILTIFQLANELLN